MPGFIKAFQSYRSLLFAFIAVILVIVILSILFKPAVNLPSDLKGTLFIRGYAVSGSENIYWKLDIQSRKLEESRDAELNTLLDIKYYQNLPKNKDEQKIIRAYLLVKNKMGEFLAKRLMPEVYKLFKNKKIFPKFDVDSDNLIVLNGLYQVKSDHKKRKIVVINTAYDKKTVISLKNHFFGQTISPDSNYIVLFENVPFAFRDGSVYQLDFINLKTGKFYQMQDFGISLPGAVLWLN